MRTRFLFTPVLATLALATVAVAAFGCSKKDAVQSSDVTTHGMSLDYKVISDGTGSDVQAYLHVGDANSNEFVQLQSGDALVLHAGGNTFSFSEVHDSPTANGTRIWYHATTPGLTSGDFLVDFTRTSGASALNNKLTLPPAFTLTVPTGTVSRKGPVTVSWDGAGGGYSATIDVDGDCISHVHHDIIGDPGNFVLSGTDLTALAGHENDNCPVTITVQREILVQETGGNFSSEFGHQCQRDAVQLRKATLQTGP